VIERIGRLNLNATLSQSMEQTGPSQKVPPKWFTKILESVELNEVRKIGARGSTIQDGGDEDNFNLVGLNNFN